VLIAVVAFRGFVFFYAGIIDIQTLNPIIQRLSSWRGPKQFKLLAE
jgi:hypothetical protein